MARKLSSLRLSWPPTLVYSCLRRIKSDVDANSALIFSCVPSSPLGKLLYHFSSLWGSLRIISQSRYTNGSRQIPAKEERRVFKLQRLNLVLTSDNSFFISSIFDICQKFDSKELRIVLLFWLGKFYSACGSATSFASPGLRFGWIQASCSKLRFSKRGDDWLISCSCKGASDLVSFGSIVLP